MFSVATLRRGVQPSSDSPKSVIEDPDKKAWCQWRPEGEVRSPRSMVMDGCKTIT